jgi:hypothetical protein
MYSSKLPHWDCADWVIVFCGSLHVQDNQSVQQFQFQTGMSTQAATFS